MAQRVLVVGILEGGRAGVVAQPWIIRPGFGHPLELSSSLSKFAALIALERVVHRAKPADCPEEKNQNDGHALHFRCVLLYKYLSCLFNLRRSSRGGRLW